MFRGRPAHAIAVGLGVLLLASPVLALAQRCCDGLVSEDRASHACPSCSARNAAGAPLVEQSSKRSCCSATSPAEEKAESSALAAGYSQCECCAGAGTQPAPRAIPANETLSSDISAFLPGGCPVADLAASTAGRESLQLTCSAMLLDCPRQALFCIWRP